MLDWVGSHKKRGTLHFKSPGQIKVNGPKWYHEATCCHPQRKDSSISELLQTQLHTNLEGEPGTRGFLVTFSSRSVSLQSPCPGGPGNLLNDHGFGYLLPQGHLMYLALVGSCRHLQSGRKSCTSTFPPKGFLSVRCCPVHWHPQSFSTNPSSAEGCKASGQPTAKFTRTGHFSTRFLAIFRNPEAVVPQVWFLTSSIKVIWKLVRNTHA